MKLYLLLALTTSLLIGLNGCKHADPTPVEPVIPSWQLNPDLQFDSKVLLGAHANANRLIVAGTKGFYQMDGGDSSFIQNGVLRILGSPYTEQTLNRPILSNQLYSSLDNGGRSISIKTIRETVAKTNEIGLAPGVSIRMDVFFPKNDVIGNLLLSNDTYKAPFGVFNEVSNAFLMCASKTDSLRNLTFGLILITRKQSSQFFADVSSAISSIGGSADYYTIMRSVYTGKFWLLPPSFQNGIGSFIAVKDYFVVTPVFPTNTPSNTFYIIYADGTVKPITVTIPFAPRYLFFYKKNLYGFDYFKGVLAVSKDGGFTWSQIPRVNLSGTDGFTEIDGKLVGYGYGQMLLIDDGTETFNYYNQQTSKLYEINNTGLVSNQITGLVQFGKKVYATTLSGLYQINLSDFFTYKNK